MENPIKDSPTHIDGSYREKPIGLELKGLVCLRAFPHHFLAFINMSNCLSPPRRIRLVFKWAKNQKVMRDPGWEVEGTT